MFIKANDGSSEYKDKHFIAELLKDAIKEIGYKKVIQVITDNANVMKVVGALIKGEYSKIFWTTCVVHTLNLALKNICATKKKTEKNEVTYDEHRWIICIADDASFIRVFIMNLHPSLSQRTLSLSQSLLPLLYRHGDRHYSLFWQPNGETHVGYFFFFLEIEYDQGWLNGVILG